MKILHYCLGIVLCSLSVEALYPSNGDVVELTSSNFDRLVKNGDEVWIVEFFAPWCGHCKNLVPEYIKAAKALKGVVKVGAIDADSHRSFTEQFGVKGFPTLKIFVDGKPTDYNDQRTASAFVEAGLKAASEKARRKLSGKSSDSGSGKIEQEKYAQISTQLYRTIPVKKAIIAKDNHRPSLDNKTLCKDFNRRQFKNIKSYKNSVNLGCLFHRSPMYNKMQQKNQ